MCPGNFFILHGARVSVKVVDVSSKVTAGARGLGDSDRANDRNGV